MGGRKSFLGDNDGLLTLYYGGGTAGIFEPVDNGDVIGDVEVGLCEAALKLAPDFPEALAFLGNIFTRRGLHEKGLALDLRLVRLRPESARANYNLACSYALLARPDDALGALERAAECGFDDAEHLARDEDLKSLHDDPRFSEIVVRVRNSKKE